MSSTPDRGRMVANVVLAVVAAAFLAGLIYTFNVSAAFADRPDWHETLRGRYLVIFGGGLVFSIACLLLPRRVKAGLALVWICLGATAVGLELFLAFSGSVGVSDPRRGSKAEFLAYMERQGVSPRPHYRPAQLATDLLLSTSAAAARPSLYPLAGMSRHAVVFCNEGGRWTLQTPDEHGFNNPLGLYRPGQVDAVIVGDAEGFCVPAGKDAGAQLRSLGLPTTLNFGKGCNGPLLMLASIREYAAFLKPRYVFWFHSEWNDLSEMETTRKIPFLMDYLKDGFSQNLVARQDEIDRYVAERTQEDHHRNLKEQQSFQTKRADLRWRRIFRFWHLRVLSGLNVAPAVKPEAHPTAAGEDTPPDLGLFGRVLGTANRQVAAWGGQLVFVYVPDSTRYFGRPGLNREGRHSRPEILSLTRDLGVPVVDLHEAVSQQRDPKSFFSMYGGHMNARGYCLTARAIADALSKTTPGGRSVPNGC